MTDMEALDEFFLVDDIAARMEWTVVPSLVGPAVRGLQAVASNPESHPDDVMRAIAALKVAVGPANVAAILVHELWDEWCPCHTDPEQYDNGSGAVVWTGKLGFVKCVDSDADLQPNLNLHSVRF